MVRSDQKCQLGDSQGVIIATVIPLVFLGQDIAQRTQEIDSKIRELGLNRNHPDLMLFDDTEKLGISEVRKIKDFLNLKPYQAKGQMIVIVAAENLTVEAQNALLKTLEEHSGDVLLLLGAGAEDQLLSTILSRCQVIHLSQPTPNKDILSKFDPDIQKLISSSAEERFKFIEKLDDKEQFLFALTNYFRNELRKSPNDKAASFLQDLLKAEKYASQNVNLRAILEYLMLKAPNLT